MDKNRPKLSIRVDLERRITEVDTHGDRLIVSMPDGRTRIIGPDVEVIKD